MVDRQLDSFLPHIRVRSEPRPEPFRPPGGRGNPSPLHRITDRRAHASRLARGLEQAWNEAREDRGRWTENLQSEGLVLTVEGWPGGFELALESLDLRRSGIELLSVRTTSDEGEIATVFVPDEKVGRFFTRLEEFASGETTTGRPRHAPLVANIEAMRRAAIEELWTEETPFPPDGPAVWWELWLRRTGDELEVLGSVAREFQWEIAERPVRFPSRTVTAVRATAESLRRALSSRLPIAEIRRPRLVQSPAELGLATQQELARELVQRLTPARDGAPVVCLLDTGIYRHTLLRDSIAPDDVLHVVGADGVDRHGHGTLQAGLALLGDLTDPLTAPAAIDLTHRLESVKVLPEGEQNPPATYASVTLTGATLPEARRPERPRVFCIANSSHDYISDGRPTSWSATVDALAFGTDVIATEAGLDLLSDPDPASGRLLVVAAGNVRVGYQLDHLAVSDSSPVEDPAQAWNVVSVGAFTDIAGVPDAPGWAGYRPLAPPGELSPYSRTSLAFQRQWPMKPDIVLEGGNMLVSPGGDITAAAAVSLVSTSIAEPDGEPFGNTVATSAATAQAARLAAMAMSEYPGLWPETTRGLLVQSARWTERMRAAFDATPNRTAKQRLLRRYGWGAPTAERVLHSASAAVTLISQNYIQPFERVDSRIRLRDMQVHALPWPRDQLLELGEVPVTLRVTLSYFVEPNPSSRGWRRRYVYPSHGLRFDIRRPGESLTDFRTRLNKLARDEETGTALSGSGDHGWYIGPNGRSLGSLHSDAWAGTAAELADCGVLGVYPVGGWWKNNNRADRADLRVRYGLLVSLYTPEEGVDLYTPIAVQVGIPIEIER